MSNYDDKVQYFDGWQANILKLKTELDNEMQKYKAEFKATFGICDGEPANVLELVKAIKAVNLLQ